MPNGQNEPPLTKGTHSTVSVAGLFSEMLGTDCATIGFILGDDAIHAPNKQHDTYRSHKSIRRWLRIFDELSEP